MDWLFQNGLLLAILLPTHLCRDERYAPPPVGKTRLNSTSSQQNTVVQPIPAIGKLSPFSLTSHQKSPLVTAGRMGVPIFEKMF